MLQSTDYIPISLIEKIQTDTILGQIAVVLDDGFVYKATVFTIDANGIHGKFTDGDYIQGTILNQYNW